MTDISSQCPIPPTLHAIRAVLGQTQEQLVERLGVSFARANRWEGGITTPQRVTRAVIAPLDAEEFGDGTR